MEARLSFVTLGVSDLARATRFYEGVLGLPLLESPPSIAFFELGKTWLALYPRYQLAADATVSWHVGDAFGLPCGPRPSWGEAKRTTARQFPLVEMKTCRSCSGVGRYTSSWWSSCRPPWTVLRRCG